MTKVRQKEIEDGAIDAQRTDLTDDFPWTGSHDFTAGTIKVPDATANDEPLSYGQYIVQAYHPPITVRAQGNLNISAPGSTIDGETMSIDDRVMCDQQTVTSQDGCYAWKGAAVPMVRTADFPIGLHVSNHIFGVRKGTDAGGLFAFVNPYGTDVVGTDDLITLSFGSEVRNVTNLMSTGLLDGGALSANADPTKFDVAAGAGWVVNNYTDPLNPTKVWVTWSAQAGISDSYLAGDKTIVVVDSTGTIIQRSSYLGNNEYPQYIQLGALAHSGGNIVSVINVPVPINDIIIQFRQFLHALGDFAISGLGVGPNDTNLYLDLGSGTVHSEGANFQTDHRVANIRSISAQSPAYIVRAYRNASSVWTYVGPVLPVDPNNYDPGGGAGLTAMTPNWWQVQKVFLLSTADQLFVQYGQAAYTTQASAISALNDPFVVSPDLVDAVFRGSIIVQQGQTNLLAADFYPATSKIGIASGGGGGAGAGEANTASNIGTAGVGVFAQKSGVDLQFKNVVAGSTKLIVTDNPIPHTISVDMVEGNVVHQSLSGAGSNTHAQVDTHIASTSNPHGVTKAQVALGNVTNDAQIKSADFPASSVDGEMALFNLATGKSLKRANQTGIIKATAGVASVAIAGTDYEAALGSGTVSEFLRGDKAWSEVPWPNRYIDGGGVSRNAINPTYQLDIAPCRARSDDNTTNIESTATITIDLTVSGLNGLDTGTEASSTWYYEYLIYNPTTKVSGGIFSLSSSTPSLPAGFTKKRRISSWYNDAGGNLRGAVQVEATFNKRLFIYENESYNTIRVLNAGTATGFTAINCSSFIPPTSTLGYFGHGFRSASVSDYGMLRPNGNTQNPPAHVQWAGNSALLASSPASSSVFMRTDSSQIIQYGSTGGTPYSYVWVYGYIEYI